MNKIYLIFLIILIIILLCKKKYKKLEKFSELNNPLLKGLILSCMNDESDGYNECKEYSYEGLEYIKGVGKDYECEVVNGKCNSGCKEVGQFSRTLTNGCTKNDYNKDDSVWKKFKNYCENMKTNSTKIKQINDTYNPKREKFLKFKKKYKEAMKEYDSINEKYLIAKSRYFNDLSKKKMKEIEDSQNIEPFTTSTSPSPSPSTSDSVPKTLEGKYKYYEDKINKKKEEIKNIESELEVVKKEFYRVAFPTKCPTKGLVSIEKNVSVKNYARISEILYDQNNSNIKDNFLKQVKCNYDNQTECTQKSYCKWESNTCKSK
jgi:hypothetical protein